MKDAPQQPPSSAGEGIIKQWNTDRRFGIIYARGGQRFFLHQSKVIEGKPELGSRVTFDIGDRRSPVDLQAAVNVRVGETVGAQ